MQNARGAEKPRVGTDSELRRRAGPRGLARVYIEEAADEGDLRRGARRAGGERGGRRVDRLVCAAVEVVRAVRG